LIAGRARARARHAKRVASETANRRGAPGVTILNPRKGIPLMFKFLGGTVGIIFLIGLIVVIAFFKLLF